MTRGFNFKGKTFTVNKAATKPIATVLAAPTTKPNQSVFDQLPHNAYIRKSQLTQSPTRKKPSASARATGLLTRIGRGIEKTAEVADQVGKIRNAIEGINKLAGAIWPFLLLLWPK